MKHKEPTTGEKWRVWESMSDYGNVLYRRATGGIPEMECSKAAAQLMKEWIRPDDRVLDIGCGVGHYLRSLRRAITAPFSYTGVDATASYISLARKAWKKDSLTCFQVADAFALPFPDQDQDIVISCNLLLHLPSIDVPIAEMIRVCRRNLLIRTLVGDRSFRIQEVRNPSTRNLGGEEEFDGKGEPTSFSYYNIYAASYIESLLVKSPRVKGYRIVPDKDYDPGEFATAQASQTAVNKTRLIDGWQVNGYILLPWHFVLIELS